jgi:hypothetical protein
MNPRRLIMGLLGAVLVGSGLYLFVYLYRWEWNRAHTAGVFLIVAEIALVALVLDARISRLESRLSRARDDERRDVRQGAPPRRRAPDAIRIQIRDAAPASRKHFAWLRPDASSTNVFVPALMGAGMVMSGLAWLIERLGRVTAKPALEGDLARRLGPLWFEAGDGLVPAASAPSASRVDGVPDVLLAPRPR